MREKAIAFLIIAAILFISGCTNTFQGMKQLWRGICQDTQTNWQKIRHADEWFKKKYW